MGGEHDVVKAALSKLGTVTLPQGGHAARHAAGLRRGRPGPHPDVHPARQPGQRLRLVLCSSSAGPGRPSRSSSRTRSACSLPPSPSRCARPQGRRSYLRGMLDDARGHGRPADRPVLAPAGRAGPGQRADHRAGAGHPAGSGHRASTYCACHDRARPDAPRPGRARPDGRCVRQGRDRAGGARVRPGAAVGRRRSAALRAGTVPKGDALAVARIAGIQGAKRTPDLVPLCHPIALHSVTVDLDGAATTG